MVHILSIHSPPLLRLVAESNLKFNKDLLIQIFDEKLIKKKLRFENKNNREKVSRCYF